MVDASGSEIGFVDAPSAASFRQPVFAADGSILVAETGPAGDALVRLAGDDLRELSRSEFASPPFYYHPSKGVPFRSTSLRNDEAGGGLVIEQVSDDGSVDGVARVAPFYSSWEPEGDRVATHVATSRLEIRSPDGSVEVVVDGTGVYQAPVWTPGGVLTLRTIDGEQRLSRWTESGIEDLAVVAGPVQFVARGKRIAVQSLSEPAGGVQTSIRAQGLPEISIGRLVVFDAASGEQETVTPDVALYFEWDPSGERLLYATIDDASTASIRWSVWADGSTTDFGTFQANPVWVRDTVPFFDQYVQSAPLWSPDGTAFAYPAVDSGNPIVVIQPLDGESVSVADAGWVTWSR